ncbi:hypothetical protein X975_01823, partial [Stegodyphus mimosarum]
MCMCKGEGAEFLLIWLGFIITTLFFIGIVVLRASKRKILTLGFTVQTSQNQRIDPEN